MRIGAMCWSTVRKIIENKRRVTKLETAPPFRRFMRYQVPVANNDHCLENWWSTWWGSGVYFIIGGGGHCPPASQTERKNKTWIFPRNSPLGFVASTSIKDVLGSAFFSTEMRSVAYTELLAERIIVGFEN
jgi:hypothetical protein